MKNNTAIRAEHVSKKFARSLKRAMTYGMIDIFKTVVIPHRYRSDGFDARLRDAQRPERPDIPPIENRKSKIESTAPRLRPTEFWALRDVNFELKYGECLGVVGKNGAGKSTLLSILSGIYSPTEGRVELSGRLQALIALGAGFHPLLSGRENIYINAAILGMSTRRIEALLDKIIEFSELHDFLDAPIKNYSSGMLVRLGFAVAIHLDPDILLIDEILAVGDISFQRKCMEKVDELRQRNMAFMLVTHNLHRIESLCERAIWLEHGRTVMEGEARDIVAAYRRRDAREALEERMHHHKHRDEKEAVVTETPFMRLYSVELQRLDGTPVSELGYGEPFKVVIHYEAKERIPKPYYEIMFLRGEFRLFQANMLVDGNTPDYVQGPGIIECTFPRPTILPGVYDIEFACKTKDGAVFLIEWGRVNSFMVTDQGLESIIGQDGIFGISNLTLVGGVHYDHEWDISKAVLKE